MILIKLYHVSKKIIKYNSDNEIVLNVCRINNYLVNSSGVFGRNVMIDKL